MSTDKRRMVNFRVTEEEDAMIKFLVQHHDRSLTKVLVRLVKDEYRRILDELASQALGSSGEGRADF